MSKSYKLKGDNYIDSKGIMHNRKKLSEYPTPSTGSASFDSNYISSIESNSYTKVGNIVTYTFTALTKGTWNNTTIFATNLPKPVAWTRFIALNTSDGDKPIRCAINTNGELRNWYSASTPAANKIIEGCITYITAD